MLNNNNNNDYNNRIILATVLSTLAIFLWMKFYVGKIAPKQKNIENKEKVENVVIDNNKNDIETVNIKDFKEEVYTEKFINIETDNLIGSINLRGLIFNNLTLKKYKKDVNSDDLVKLLSSQNEENPYFINFSWESQSDIELPNENSIWVSNTDKLTLNNPITLTWKNKQNIIFKLTISIDENYMFKINQSVINNSNNPISFNIINSINKANVINKDRIAVFEGFNGVFNKSLKEIKYTKIKNKKVFDNGYSWAGFTDKYWQVSLFTNDTKSNLYNVDVSRKDNYFVLNIVGNKSIINPKEELNTEFLLFTGPKILSLFDNYSSQYNIPLFDRSIDFGWFYFISKPMYMILKMFNNFFKNFGVSILFLTFLIKCIIMYPITKKSFVSMANMKRIQPKIDYIKKTYSNDKMRLNKELVELYSKEKISPMSGCLPLIIQIPVFFSLYKVLIISIDMRQAPFFWFIKNLSDKDPTTIWNLFGLLPFTPKFLHIGILPILMSLTMWWQQRISSKNMSTQSSQEMASATKIMPIMFLLIFSSMPSGLLIYWIFSNIITIAQQYYIEKKLKIR